MKLKVSILGSGNVATVFGQRIKKAGHSVLQVYSRSAENAGQLADLLDAVPTSSMADINNAADIYIIALSDDAIANAAAELGNKKGLVLHTAGSVSMKVLQNTSAEYGILYPLQSLRKEKTDYHNIPLLIDGNTPKTLDYLSDFAKTISPLVQLADDAYRLKLHVAAVFVSNFTNHLYNLAAGYCEVENLNFELLKPLIMETAERLEDYHPNAVQTGPAKRKDITTMEKHVQMLAKYPEMQEIYGMMSGSIGKI